MGDHDTGDKGEDALLGVAGSSMYYTANMSEFEENVELMRLIDPCYTHRFLPWGSANRHVAQGTGP